MFAWAWTWAVREAKCSELLKEKSPWTILKRASLQNEFSMDSNTITSYTMRLKTTKLEKMHWKKDNKTPVQIMHNVFILCACMSPAFYIYIEVKKKEANKSKRLPSPGLDPPLSFFWKTVLQNILVCLNIWGVNDPVDCGICFLSVQKNQPGVA